MVIFSNTTSGLIILYLVDYAGDGDISYCQLSMTMLVHCCVSVCMVVPGLVLKEKLGTGLKSKFISFHNPLCGLVDLSSILVVQISAKFLTLIMYGIYPLLCCISLIRCSSNVLHVL